MTRTQSYQCNRCGGVLHGDNSYMSAPPEISFRNGAPDWEEIDLKKTYEHCCETCQSALSDLISDAISEWKEGAS